MTDTDLLVTPVASAESDSVEHGAREPRTTESNRAETTRGGADAVGELSGMLLPQLRGLAVELGIRGTSGMRKGALITAIKQHQAAPVGRATAPVAAAPEAPAAPEPTAVAPVAVASAAPAPAAPAVTAAPGAAAAPAADSSARVAEPAASASEESAPAEPVERTRRRAQRDGAADDQAVRGDGDRAQEAQGERRRERGGQQQGGQNGAGQNGAGGQNSNSSNNNQNNNNQNNGGQRGDNQRGGDNQRADNQRGDNQRGDNQRGDNQRGDNQRGDNQRGDNRDDEGEGRGRRGRRFRERGRRRERGGEAGGNNNVEPEIREDDVLQPVAGILDVLDNYAFVRTSGYLAGSNDVYVSMNLIRKNGLRRGDAITGAVRAPRDKEQANQRQKFDPLVRLDTVNGGDVEAAKRRPEFGKLTPLYPNQRLRLETSQTKLTTRVIDIVMPIGKGQRALIVSPPKAGKTMILQDIANAIATNNPECYLMVVLVDERPEEVTDMQRSVRGEVIASTFDRPPSDHTSVAELAIERAKRLVEMGKDVVVLLDSITRLGRAYNNSSPASGRILSGGVDSTALYPPKRFLGAARNIEHGGSLTIIATAMVETGSTGDTVIYEEFKGTGNAELKLDRKIAERRVFPAVDINPSSTRHDELLMAPDEIAVVHKLRRVLSGLDSQQAIDVLIERLKKTRSNVEFLMQVSKTAPGGGIE